MHNINYMLAKALQSDHLRSARQGRMARLMGGRRRQQQTAGGRKKKSH